MIAQDFGIPREACGLRLCVIRKSRGEEQLLLCEPVKFTMGYPAVITVIHRAQICGQVGRLGQCITEFGGNWFADVLNADGDLIDVLPMSREAWNSLKNKWMRCRMQVTP